VFRRRKYRHSCVRAYLCARANGRRLSRRCSCRLCAKRSPCAVLGMPWLSLFGKLRGDIAIVLKADRQSPTRATDTQMGGCDHMRVCCQAQTCQYVIKCAERAGAGLRAPVAFVSGIGTMAQAPHRFQTWCLPRTFGLISSVNGREVRIDRFGVSALCWFCWNGHSIAARRPEGRVQSSMFHVSGFKLKLRNLSARVGPFC
jgi:hypothetical protein